MRFLRLKPRRIEAVKNGVNEEEDEEGRQGLLPLTSKNEQSSVAQYLHCDTGADQALQTMHHTLPPPLSSNINKQLEQAAVFTSQMIVLNASLHCQGCVRKLKKTLSKLQGVQTYHVDMEQEKVTVIGNVCPDNVLQSVNKVIKGAQLWAAPNKLPTSPQQL